MLRSRRCTECGSLFMSAAETICGTCRGDAPEIVSERDLELIAKANAQPPKAPQTVDIKALTGLGASAGVTNIGPAPAPKPKRTRKPKAAPDGNA